MGLLAQSAWIIRVFAALLMALSPGLAVAAATALGRHARRQRRLRQRQLNVSLTTAGANREGWRATNVAGATLVQGEGQAGSHLAARIPASSAGVLAFAAGRHAKSGPMPTWASTPPDASEYGRVLCFLRLHVAAGPAVVLRSLRHLPADGAAGTGGIGAQGPDARPRCPGADGVACRRGRRTRPFPPRLTAWPVPAR